MTLLVLGTAIRGVGIYKTGYGKMEIPVAMTPVGLSESELDLWAELVDKFVKEEICG